MTHFQYHTMTSLVSEASIGSSECLKPSNNEANLVNRDHLGNDAVAEVFSVF